MNNNNNNNNQKIVGDPFNIISILNSVFYVINIIRCGANRITANCIRDSAYVNK